MLLVTGKLKKETYKGKESLRLSKEQKAELAKIHATCDEEDSDINGSNDKVCDRAPSGNLHSTSAISVSEGDAELSVSLDLIRSLTDEVRLLNERIATERMEIKTLITRLLETH
eukprot:Seg3828.1 transcript_id=Seg3828.1/GoldUCD/mRNA.D3Y31 product="hypothetical protein" protein_id=Seg3828.1/GoldUCD/D3Y31